MAIFDIYAQKKIKTHNSEMLGKKSVISEKSDRKDITDFSEF